MQYESDPGKAALNLKTHGVGFDEASTCLLDPNALEIEDPDAEGEQRHILLGMSSKGRVLVVVYTMRGDVPRIISARKASKGEVKRYAR